jgi:hypothetical protein
MSRLCAAAVLAGLTVIGVESAPSLQLQTPTDWKWRTDAPATVEDSDKDMAADAWFYVAMPPDWHITTRPGTTLYHPAHTGRGQFRVQSEAFLFPGTSTAEYGVFVGGRDLDGTAAPSYTAFVARRDGRIAVLKRTAAGTTALVDWTANGGAVPHPGEGTAKNVFTVEALASEVVFLVNEAEVARLPRTEVNLDGFVGLRAGADMNLHVSTFDVTYRLAPTQVKR